MSAHAQHAWRTPRARENLALDSTTGVVQARAEMRSNTTKITRIPLDPSIATKDLSRHFSPRNPQQDLKFYMHVGEPVQIKHC